MQESALAVDNMQEKHNVEELLNHKNIIIFKYIVFLIIGLTSKDVCCIFCTEKVVSCYSFVC